MVKGPNLSRMNDDQADVGSRDSSAFQVHKVEKSEVKAVMMPAWWMPGHDILQVPDN